MKNLLITFALFFSFYTFATEVPKIEIPEGYKIEGTFSATIDKNSSYHAVITKKKGEKSYSLFSSLVNENGDSKVMNPIQLENLPSILSHHSNGDIITLLGFNEKKKKLVIIDINTKNSENTITVTKSKKPYLLFRLDHKTVLINKSSSKKNLTIRHISNGTESKTLEYKIPNNRLSEFKLITQERSVAINRNEYVETGSIDERKAYISENSLVLTLDNKANSLTKTISFNLDNNEESDVSFKTFNIKSLNKIKNHNSYLYDENLFTITSNKEDLILKSYDLENEEENASFSLSENLKNIYSENDSFLKNAGKSRMKPTLTINISKENNYLINIDQVDKKTYNYHYNWWFHHWMWQQQMWQQQMMIQQQQQNMMNSIPSRFGPNPENYINTQPIIANVKPIQFVLSNDFKILENGSKESKYKNIDKDEELKPFKENKKMKEVTACFTESQMRYVYLDKKTGEVFIKTKELK